MMLVWGSQSCVRNGDKAGQSWEENGGEARQISLEHVSCRLCGRFHGFVYAFHWYVSLSEFELSSDVAFGLLQADQSSATATARHGINGSTQQIIHMHPVQPSRRR